MLLCSWSTEFIPSEQEASGISPLTTPRGNPGKRLTLGWRNKDFLMPGQHRVMLALLSRGRSFGWCYAWQCLAIKGVWALLLLLLLPHSFREKAPLVFLDGQERHSAADW